MIALSPTATAYCAVEAVDFRNGIDGLARLCRTTMEREPMGGGVFLFDFYTIGYYNTLIILSDVCKKINKKKFWNTPLYLNPLLKAAITFHFPRFRAV